ncbi:MAG: porin family protein [Acidobacteriia bacterium]|jgi:opacity protein-like surface antigen|nr:porin family protein [Terriglobia bacterium]
MRTRLYLCTALLLISLPAAAQTTPAVEIFGGYQYARINPGEGVDGFNQNGWNAALQVNANNWFGIVADFSGVYGSPTISIPGVGSAEVDTNFHSFLFGPQISYRGHERVTPFVRALFGAIRANAEAFGTAESQTAFGMALGGGVDVNVHDRVAIRLIQADYVLSRFEGFSGQTENQHNARLSFGVVFRLGSRD